MIVTPASTSTSGSGHTPNHVTHPRRGEVRAVVETVLAAEEQHGVREARGDEEPCLAVVRLGVEHEDADGGEGGGDEAVVECSAARIPERDAAADECGDEPAGGVGDHRPATASASDAADRSALDMKPTAPERATRAP